MIIFHPVLRTILLINILLIQITNIHPWEDFNFAPQPQLSFHLQPPRNPVIEKQNHRVVRILPTNKPNSFQIEQRISSTENSNSIFSKIFKLLWFFNEETESLNNDRSHFPKHEEIKKVSNYPTSSHNNLLSSLHDVNCNSCNESPWIPIYGINPIPANPTYTKNQLPLENEDSKYADSNLVHTNIDQSKKHKEEFFLQNKVQLFPSSSDYNIWNTRKVENSNYPFHRKQIEGSNVFNKIPQRNEVIQNFPRNTNTNFTNSIIIKEERSKDNDIIKASMLNPPPIPLYNVIHASNKQAAFPSRNPFTTSNVITSPPMTWFQNITNTFSNNKREFHQSDKDNNIKTIPLSQYLLSVEYPVQQSPLMEINGQNVQSTQPLNPNHHVDLQSPIKSILTDVYRDIENSTELNNYYNNNIKSDDNGQSSSENRVVIHGNVSKENISENYVQNDANNYYQNEKDVIVDINSLTDKGNELSNNDIYEDFNTSTVAGNLQNTDDIDSTGTDWENFTNINNSNNYESNDEKKYIENWSYPDEEKSHSNERKINDNNFPKPITNIDLSEFLSPPSELANYYNWDDTIASDDQTTSYPKNNYLYNDYAPIIINADNLKRNPVTEKEKNHIQQVIIPYFTNKSEKSLFSSSHDYSRPFRKDVANIKNTNNPVFKPYYYNDEAKYINNFITTTTITPLINWNPAPFKKLQVMTNVNNIENIRTDRPYNDIKFVNDADNNMYSNELTILRKTIDNLTAEGFSNHKQQKTDRLLQVPVIQSSLSASKEIPAEYFNNAQVPFRRHIIPAIPESENNNITADIQSSVTKTTVENVTISEKYSRSQENQANFTHSKYDNENNSSTNFTLTSKNMPWENIPISLSPITKEKVYVVTPITGI